MSKTQELSWNSLQDPHSLPSGMACSPTSIAAGAAVTRAVAAAAAAACWEQHEGGVLWSACCGMFWSAGGVANMMHARYAPPSPPVAEPLPDEPLPDAFPPFPPSWGEQGAERLSMLLLLLLVPLVAGYSAQHAAALPPPASTCHSNPLAAPPSHRSLHSQHRSHHQRIRHRRHLQGSNGEGPGRASACVRAGGQIGWWAHARAQRSAASPSPSPAACTQATQHMKTDRFHRLHR